MYGLPKSVCVVPVIPMSVLLSYVLLVFLYVCLWPIPLAFHCSMLNDLSDMVGVWAGLGSGEGARGRGGIIQAVQIQPSALR